MTKRSELRAEPWRFDMFAVMRELERGTRARPRIGDSTTIAEDVVVPGQDPFVEFPASNLSEFDDGGRGPPKMMTRFLGFLGPQGALPLTTTVDAYNWSNRRDPSFARFCDIFGTRFLQLFFRAWADARAIAHHDRPDADRFGDYVGTFAGIGTAPFAERDSVPDIAKLAFAGLVAPQVKSAARLASLVRGIFHVDVEIEENIGMWLVFHPDDCMSIGMRGSTLGADTFLGQRAYSINDKVRISIRTKDIDQYCALLPSGSLSDKLTDLVFFYLGHRFDFDVELALPAREAIPARLGASGALGWTAWIAPDRDAPEDKYLKDARFHPMERRRSEAGH